MNSIKNAMNELKKFGLYEVALHMAYRLSHDEQVMIKMYAIKDNYYKNLTISGIENEIKMQYKTKMGCELDLESPETFTEKIQWLKIHDCTAEKTLLADKFLVRDWVSGKGLDGLKLVPLINAWNDINEVDFDCLPNAFCLKMNHGSGMNYVVTDKTKMDEKKIRDLFKAWNAQPYYLQSLEFQYLNIPRKILAEKYMEELGGGFMTIRFIAFMGSLRLSNV